jgi:hypothetical protein
MGSGLPRMKLLFSADLYYGILDTSRGFRFLSKADSEARSSSSKDFLTSTSSIPLNPEVLIFKRKLIVVV